MASTLTFHHLTHTWPDGTTVLRDVDLTLNAGVHGLVAPNGAGKSTLLRLAAGDLQASRGQVVGSGLVVRLPQAPWRHARGRSVASALGVDAELAALRAVESGSLDPRDFAVLDAGGSGGGWDVEGRSAAWLSRLGLTEPDGRPLDVDRGLDGLSGGELSLLQLAAAMLREPDVLLLDEPTNNLDARARSLLQEALSSFDGTVLAASHDRAFLESVESVVEIHDGAVRSFSGGWTAYESARQLEDDSARRAVRDARADLQRQRRELLQTRTKLDRRARTAQRAEREKRVPKIVAHGLRSRAEVSTGRLRNEHREHVDDARRRLDDAEHRVRDDAHVRLELPATRVPNGREVLRTRGLVLPHVGTEIDLTVRGPERIAVTGPNGSGKTTLLRVLLGELAPAAGAVDLRVPAAHLSQRPEVPDPAASVLENVRMATPRTSPQDVRALLARLLFRGTDADRAVEALSGGERLRATLACLLLADPAPQLIVLDEPTNDLDLPSVAHLEEALDAFEGALLVVSHDELFIDALRPTRRIDVGGGRA